MRFLLVLLIALVVVGMAFGGRVCKSPDCSDVVGHAMVKDNLHTTKHIAEAQHRQHMEYLRTKRLNLLKKERATE